MTTNLFRKAIGAALALGFAAINAQASVWLSSYSFAPNNLPTISSNDALSSQYKLRFKVNGNQYENKTNNNGQKVDSAPPPGSYTTYLYYLQYDSTGTNLLTIGPQVAQNLTVLSPVNGVTWNGIYMPSTGVPGNTITFSASVTNSGNTLWDNNYFLELKDASGNHLYYPGLATTAPGGSISPTFSLTLPSTAGTYTYYFTALQNGVQYFGPTQSATIVVNTNPTTSLSASSTAVNLGQSVTLTSVTTDPDSNLTSQAIDYIPPGGGSWVSGTSGNGNRWDGGPTGSNTLANTMTMSTAGTWQFRARGGDSLGGLSGFQYVNVSVSSGTPPTITTQPSNVTATQGQAASFTVAASGTAPLSFQWRKNGTNISGATAATLSLTNVQSTDVATYSCYVSNSYGSATSNNATLTVNPPAPVITSGTAASGTVGAAFSGYQITASNSPTSFGATNLPPGLSVNSSGYISGTPSTAGTYSTTISAANAGGTGSATLTFTIASAPPSPPVITSATTASGTAGTAFGGYQITATNSPTSYSASGLPPGLSANASGYISGTPSSSGTYNATVSASNAGGTGNLTVTFTIGSAAPQNDTNNTNQLNIHLPY
jgi:hypothetical protein